MRLGGKPFEIAKEENFPDRYGVIFHKDQNKICLQPLLQSALAAGFFGKFSWVMPFPKRKNVSKHESEGADSTFISGQISDF